MIRKVPNWLTLSRVALIPFFVYLMHEPSRAMVNLATLVFIFAALTDWVDGYMARRYGAVSDFGKLLDPVADKILVMAALVMLVAQRGDVYGDPWVPGWMVVLVLARETWVTGLRAVAAGRGMIVAANNSGKYKSGIQMGAIILLLLHDYTFTLFGLKLTCQLVGINFLLISIAFSYYGAVEYTRMILFQEKQSHNVLEPEHTGTAS